MDHYEDITEKYIKEKQKMIEKKIRVRDSLLSTYTLSSKLLGGNDALAEVLEY